MIQPSTQWPNASNLSPHAALVIFAKAPIPGKAKTRVCPPLTSDEAAMLHGSFVLDMLERTKLAVATLQLPFQRYLACTPSSEHVFFKIMEERQGVKLIDQVGDDLGERTQLAFGTMFGKGYQRVFTVGTDVPSLPLDYYTQALAMLETNDLVLGPALDGGYYLIGLKRTVPDLFIGIPWSTARVASMTLEKATTIRLKTALLPPWWDVDTIEDLRVLIESSALDAKKPKNQQSFSTCTSGTLQRLANRLRSQKVVNLWRKAHFTPRTKNMLIKLFCLDAPLMREWKLQSVVFIVGTVLSFCMIVADIVAADFPALLQVGRFSSAQVGQTLPEGWKPLTFKKIPKQTAYELIKDGDVVVVKAVSDASASGFIKVVNIDPKEYPIVRWRWKVENILKHNDVTRKDGDDFPARLYITFAYDPDKVSFGKKLKFKAGQAIFGDIPIGALNYIWDTKTPIGTFVENAYTDFAQMVVVESGEEKVGLWVSEERNVYEDYKQAFGEEPPLMNGVAIMTDTDNTKERATAYYGDIVFVKGK